MGMALFLVHYTNRTFIYPLRMRGAKPTRLLSFALAMIFCTINGYIQARMLSKFAIYHPEWCFDGQFLLGVTLWAFGWSVNYHSDEILRNLRKPGEKGYKIPRGGMFEYVSGANFFGEIVEWAGFAVACNTWVATSFAVATALNIGPRAMQHRQWYLQKFEDYPEQRKALIPFVL